MSEEHIRFLKQEKKRHFLVLVVQIFLLLAFLFLWQLLGDFKIINTFIMSSPRFVVKTIGELVFKKRLFYHIGITIYETVISFGLGTFLGIFLASLMWWNPFLKKVLDPYLTVLNSLPKVALGPMIIVWCGANMKSVVLMALFISVIVMTMTVIETFHATDESKITLFKVLGANKYQIFFKLVLPSSYQTIMSGLKICMSMSLIGLLPPVGEKIFFNKCYSRYLFHYHLL